MKKGIMAMLDKRGKNGRFLPGHGGGPGNPHAQRVHRLRAALLSAVTPEDVKEIVYKLVSMAKQGDIAAIKELLDRTIGKPVTAVEVTGADGEPLLQFARLQEVIMAALAEFPDARIAVALSLRELIDAESPGTTGDPAGSEPADGAADV